MTEEDKRLQEEEAKKLASEGSNLDKDKDSNPNPNDDGIDYKAQFEATKAHNAKLVEEARKREQEYKEIKNQSESQRKESLEKEGDFEKLWELTKQENAFLKQQDADRDAKSVAQTADLLADKYLNKLEEKLGGKWANRKIAKTEVDFSGAVPDPVTGEFSEFAITEEANRIMKEDLDFLVKFKNPALEDDEAPKQGSESKATSKGKKSLADIMKKVV